MVNNNNITFIILKRYNYTNMGNLRNPYRLLLECFEYYKKGEPNKVILVYSAKVVSLKVMANMNSKREKCIVNNCVA